MKVICSGRQTGRTTKLIKLCAEAESRGEVSYIVCHSRDEASRIADQAKELGLTIGFPIMYSEFLVGSYAGMNIKNFYIDNVEFLLQYLTPVKISAVSITDHGD